MTLQQLEYIVALDNYQHFVTASEHCFVTQPTLTMQVQKLENELGFLLFDRSKKPIVPTKVGAIYINKARGILNSVKELDSFISEEKTSIKGIFNLGIIPSLAPYLLPLFLPEFILKYPSTKLIIQELKTEHIIESMEKGSLDIALVATPLENDNIKEIPLFNEPFLAYLPSSHRLLDRKSIDVKDLKKEELLLLSEGHCFRNQTLNICNHSNVQSKFTYESDSIETLKMMVDNGLGHTLVPFLSTLNDRSSCRPFSKPEPSREISLICSKGYSKHAVIEVLRSSIVSCVPEHLVANTDYQRIRWMA